VANTQKQVPVLVPTDEEGEPLALISSTVQELIPTAKFANVTISNTVTRFVQDNKVKEGLKQSYNEADEVLQGERDKILEDIETGNS
jgi:hypothetical protein